MIMEELWHIVDVYDKRIVSTHLSSTSALEECERLSIEYEELYNDLFDPYVVMNEVNYKAWKENV